MAGSLQEMLQSKEGGEDLRRAGAQAQKGQGICYSPSRHTMRERLRSPGKPGLLASTVSCSHTCVSLLHEASRLAKWGNSPRDLKLVSLLWLMSTVCRLRQCTRGSVLDKVVWVRLRRK
jgi:hypothetical protein